jgi:hypothetical protein
MEAYFRSWEFTCQAKLAYHREAYFCHVQRSERRSMARDSIAVPYPYIPTDIRQRRIREKRPLPISIRSRYQTRNHPLSHLQSVFLAAVPVSVMTDRLWHNTDTTLRVCGGLRSMIIIRPRVNFSTVINRGFLQDP